METKKVNSNTIHALKNTSFSNLVLNCVSRMLPLHASYIGWMWLKGKKCLGIE